MQRELQRIQRQKNGQRRHRSSSTPPPSSSNSTTTIIERVTKWQGNAPKPAHVSWYESTVNLTDDISDPMNVSETSQFLHNGGGVFTFPQSWRTAHQRNDEERVIMADPNLQHCSEHLSRAKYPSVIASSFLLKRW